ncbi:MAG: cohesin domain-containing protein, partial [Bacteroidales bacterium]|nr:cohesin domain-containing protein [Bacteroidales bacterium]
MGIKSIRILIFVYLISVWSVLCSQSITTTIITVTACPGDTAVIPVYVTNFNDVAAISLTLKYDTVVFDFVDYQNLHNALATGMFLLNNFENKIIISWTSLDPAIIGNDTLLEFKFVMNGGTSELIWDTITPGSCEYSDFYGNIIPAYFINGEIISDLNNPTLFSPQNASSNITINPTLVWNTCNCNPIYNIQLSTDSVFSNIIIDSTGLEETFFDVSGLEETTKYFWHIKAEKSQQIT